MHFREEYSVHHFRSETFFFLEQCCNENSSPSSQVSVAEMSNARQEAESASGRVARRLEGAAGVLGHRLDQRAADYVFSNSELERIFSNV